MKKESKVSKIIVDSNIWISFLIGNTLQGLQNYIDSGNISVMTCDEQIRELNDVFERPKIRRYISGEQVDEFFCLLEDFSEIITLKSHIDLCRDPKDNYLLSLALDSNADFLITGDFDLLELNHVGNTRIISFSEFKQVIGI